MHELLLSELMFDIFLFMVYYLLNKYKTCDRIYYGYLYYSLTAFVV